MGRIGETTRPAGAGALEDDLHVPARLIEVEGEGIERPAEGFVAAALGVAEDDDGNAIACVGGGQGGSLSRGGEETNVLTADGHSYRYQIALCESPNDCQQRLALWT
jgi:hypothetical protein